MGTDFDWNRARALLATIDGCSLTAAAHRLGSSQPTVGRAITALEQELGVVLFDRVGNQLHPTPVALELAGHIRAMEAAAHQVSLTASGASRALTGTVSISASEGIAVFLLPEILRSLRAAHPGIELRLVVTNQASDLSRRQADIAVRNFQPRTPDLLARKVRDATAGFYASPEYLDRWGPASGPDDLARADFIAFEPMDEYLAGLHTLGMPVRREQFTVVCANHMAQWALVQAGLGIAMLMEEIVAPPSRLLRVPHTPLVPVPMWLICRRELHKSRRVRVVFDALATGLAVTTTRPAAKPI
ncbi:MAG: LysR family transcriptional regulator [Myxococcales bacterium]|nr:LysR family transcriptional regulator [Myxococcales bacterium]